LPVVLAVTLKERSGDNVVSFMSWAILNFNNITLQTSVFQPAANHCFKTADD